MGSSRAAPAARLLASPDGGAMSFAGFVVFLILPALFLVLGAKLIGDAITGFSS